ncbi:uncharacterized protein LOC130999387 isoform X2 [Salvia miltiorrhiza]|uniref:uncharacterized protein LOC130999387 isoform X2 n=1 Tax=Salvia miltiorrhiza TaxID=226208 RepID=UPI0025ACC978|nr:uncharacterized protein LOC130999387 isoform X2 [Salvia miltiorrhiza]
MNPLAQDVLLEENKKYLFQSAMKSKWGEVIKAYKKNKQLHTAKITSSGDTALHIAISNGEESVVEELVKIVSKTEGALKMQNELGNTPLHLAAYLSNANMCRCIASCDSTLMGIRNTDNETPFFLAVRHGNLAFDIMTHYDKLLNAVNEHGLSPLHVLANKPTAFRSGSHVRGLHKLIYHCIFVDELQHETMHNQGVDLHYKDTAKYPENYHTCFTTFNLLWDVMRVLLGYSRKKHVENIKREDVENPKGHQNILMMVLCGSRKADEERRQFEVANKKVDYGRKKHDEENIKDEKPNVETPKGRQEDKPMEESSKRKAQGHEFLPKNYINIFNVVKLISKAMLVILGLGSKSVEKIREKKSQHIWSIQIMEKLLEHASLYQYEDNGKSPAIIPQGLVGKDTPISSTLPDIDADFNPIADENPPKPLPNKEAAAPCGKCEEMLCSVLNSLGLVQGGNERRRSDADMEKKETPILIAAKRGVVEMVEGILERFPVAIHDMNVDRKNVVLLAVEHRQPYVYKFLLDWRKMKDTIFRKTDKNGNSALHLAARLGEHKPWLIPGAALQMQWELKWFKFVKDSMPTNFFPRHNNDSETPWDIFNDTHDKLTKEGAQWLVNTSQSCSVVAALIATVAFATSSTVPGGVKDDNSGTPTLQNQPAFSIFAISSLVALCFSVTAVIMFLAILTSRFQDRDFGADLPRKLLVGLTSLFVSIGAMLLSFCAGHFFVLQNNLQYAAFPMYAITCLPVTFFAINQFPLYFDLVWATIRKLPQRSSN